MADTETAQNEAKTDGCHLKPDALLDWRSFGRLYSSVLNHRPIAIESLHSRQGDIPQQGRQIRDIAANSK